MLLGAASAVKVESQTAVKADEPLTQPLEFHQRLLACNAYPGAEGVSILKNSKAVKSHDKLQFNQCRWIDGRIFPQDRVSFKFEKEGVQGTFEVEELPDADSTLLLIVQRRDAKDTDLLSFQSYAFPTSSPEQAKVAFINAVAGDSEDMLEMADASVDSGKNKNVSRRVEDIKYNRVYAIEAGKYEVSLLHHGKKAASLLENKPAVKDAKNAKKPVADKKKAEKLAAEKKKAEAKEFAEAVKTLNLVQGHDYVVMKTGSLDGKTQLVAFPTNEVIPMTTMQMVTYASFVIAPIMLVLAGFFMYKQFSAKKGAKAESAYGSV